MSGKASPSPFLAKYLNKTYPLYLSQFIEKNTLLQILSNEDKQFGFVFY